MTKFVTFTETYRKEYFKEKEVVDVQQSKEDYQCTERHWQRECASWKDAKLIKNWERDTQECNFVLLAHKVSECAGIRT